MWMKRFSVISASSAQPLIRIFAELLAVVTAAEPIHQPMQPGQLRGRGASSSEPRGHAFERRHDRDHLDDFALRLAHDEDAAAWARPNKALLLEQGHRLPDRCATDPEILREPALVEADLSRMVIDVHRGNRPFQR